jgi:aminoglycoside phosphotransferase (APT) family kinase protein
VRLHARVPADPAADGGRPLIEEVRRLLDAHGLDPGGELIRTDGGVVNPCFLSPRLAVRLNVRDPELPKFANEVRAYALARGRVPVPDVLVLDTARSVIPWDALVTTRLSGAPAADGWAQLDPARRRARALSAGWALATLHTVSPPGFGELLSPVATWREAWARRVDRSLAEAVAVGEIDERDAERARRRLSDPPDVVRPALVHADFHLHDLLVRDDDVVGVLDLEWSVAGDPVLDLACVWTFEQEWPDAVGPLLEAYAPATGWEERLAFYRGLLDIESCVILRTKFLGRHSWAERELAEHRERVRAWL